MLATLKRLSCDSAARRKRTERSPQLPPDLCAIACRYLGNRMMDSSRMVFPTRIPYAVYGRLRASARECSFGL